jgi:hypothetical protein
MIQFEKIFPNCWVDLGIINHESYVGLSKRMIDDVHPEHWQIAAISEFASTNPVVSKDWLVQYESCMSKCQPVYAEALLLVVSREIQSSSEEGYKYVAAKFSELGRWADLRLIREQLKLIIDCGDELDDDTLRKYAQEGDKEIRELLIRYFPRNRGALEIIAKLGNKSQRNRAQVAIENLG